MQELIDIIHLNEQTFGDEALRRDVLIMFQDQTPILVNALLAAEGTARSDIAHRLKGSCLAIGANKLSELASEIENTPDRISTLQVVTDETLREIAKLLIK